MFGQTYMNQPRKFVCEVRFIRPTSRSIVMADESVSAAARTRVILKLLSVMFGQVGRVDNVLNSIAQQND